ncbi:MAG: CBASS cGAMP-activated phospholipase [Syntrophobacteraceae bacterium]
MDGKFKVLSIDGGGIRGIIPAIILSEIERRTGKGIAKLFDLIAGTSTGGILALGCARPGPGGAPAYDAAQLVKLYEEEGDKIFSRSVWHRIRAVGSAVEEKYPNGPIEAVLRQYFGDAMISEAVTNVLVTSYEIEQRRPFFFKSLNAKKNPHEDDFLMRDAARATSAAPTYFEPARIRTSAPPGHLALVDGGVFANNPSACALAEAISKFDAQPRDVYMLSLGTGELTRPIMYEEAKGWGLLQWAQPLLNVVFDGVSDAAHYHVDSILNKTGEAVVRYHRFQLTLDKGNDDMDDASRTNLYVLRSLTEDLVRKNDKLIDEICGELAG